MRLFESARTLNKYAHLHELTSLVFASSLVSSLSAVFLELKLYNMIKNENIMT